MITYNKLVRDKIIDKIENSWWTAKHHTADDAEFAQKLKEKVIEEAQELNKAKTIEEIKNELGDVFRTAQEIKKLYNISDEELTDIIKKKDEKAGGFDKRIILEEASEF